MQIGQNIIFDVLSEVKKDSEDVSAGLGNFKQSCT
jgi:hypothetical protein